MSCYLTPLPTGKGRTKNMDASDSPHAVLVPFPAQGHVNPMMQLAHKLVNSHGFFITFVLTEFDHARLLQANFNRSPPLRKQGADMIRLIPIQDGLGPSDSRTDFPKLCKSLESSMGPLLRNLIQQINEREDQRVTCMIADVNVSGWALDVATHFRIPSAAFWPALTATYATFYHIPTLLSSGILTSTGVPKENKTVKCFHCMPPFNPRHLMWVLGKSEDDSEFLFRYTVRNMERVKHANWVIFNSFYELEAAVIDGLFVKEASICPIGPLIPFRNLNGNGSEGRMGINTSFWAEEVECLDWLDRQSAESVIYVSLGSIAVLNAMQFEELALGLEATGRPFLWVVRPDLMDGTTAVFPTDFKERVKHRGCLVSWAPQVGVLSHPSVACFLTHCGWNSTLESITMGVPMICWPYFADQFLNRTYVVDVWKIGLALNAKGDGIIEKSEIKEAVDRILGEDEGVEMKRRVLELKKSAREAVEGGGSSSINYNSFVRAMTTTTSMNSWCSPQKCEDSHANKKKKKRTRIRSMNGFLFILFHRY